MHKLLQHLVAYIHYPLIRALFRFRVEGLEHVPLEGPVLLCPNHASYMDPATVSFPVYFRRPGRLVRFMALAEYFNGGTGLYCRLFDAFPVPESGPALGSFRNALRTLAAGRILGIFPEGGRTRDGRLLEFQTGAARIAAEARVPILPVTLNGTFECWPPHRRLFRPGRIEVIYHEPVTLDHDRRKDIGYLKEVTARIRAAVESRYVVPAGALPPEPLEATAALGGGTGEGMSQR